MPSPFPFAPNQYGVATAPFDFNAGTPPPDTQTYHGFFLVANNRIVGRLQEFQTTHFARGGNHVFELNQFTAGHPVDYVPTVVENFQANFLHDELWDGEIELALGFPRRFVDLTDQNRPFEMEEWLLRGPELYNVDKYVGCWFKEKNREAFNAQGGDYQIKARGVIAFVNVQEVF
jgi:hypothetical protein